MASLAPTQSPPSTRKSSFLVLRRTVVCLLALLGAVVVLVTVTPIVSWWAGKLAGPWNDPKGDVLIILAGSSNDGGELGYSSYLRAQYGANAYFEGFKSVVVCGGGEPHPQSQVMASLLEYRGVPSAVVHLETGSNSTRENALFAKPILAQLPGSKVLLTSDYHMFRAYRVFRKAGIDVVPRPFPDARKRGSRWYGRWSAFMDLAQESIKIVYYRARGWI